jgi:signal transduction histidine kinase
VQVIMALVLNAIDASADGARVLVRTAHVRAGSTDACGVDVVDEGHGIPRDALSKVFEPFYTTKEPGRGTGLGLSICYGLVLEHGGLLAVDSMPGRGATFRMLLPALGAPPLVGGAETPALIHAPIGSTPS